ncbi:uncharacterized protein MRET_3984 [Malassezia restricta]|uniref:uncharacterized protein n=1 Tax=Malassezia restricta TaxID=76775 RepID=UPI000DD1274C|nr:uncharacterized protein MRET_3984 [Malassezia restricta]AXA52083.1 uncharacterized protein MRET_3984 [Malassezia restricta]
MSRNASSKAEVIQEWADFDANGATFERGRMEANIQSLCFHEPAGVSDEMKDRHKGVKVKGSDVTSLTSELLVEPEVAEAALVKAGGDLDEAFHLLLQHTSVP